MKYPTFAEAHYPTESLTPEELDQYLAEGWFRIGQTIFTCTYLNLYENFLRVIWLRVVLDKFTNDSKLLKLTKLNSKFKIVVKQASVTPEKEELFERYKTGIAFQASESLQSLLYGDCEYNIYNTLEINIYDGNKLIAVGYFDVGKNSAAGISCFYDPDYKKHSLGKFLIYQKMLYCKDHNIQYFYLGYFTPGYKSFDYKLQIAKESLEYFDLSKQNWEDIKSMDLTSGSIEETKHKLTLLQQQLDNVNIESRVLRYRFFEANLVPELNGMELFDYFMFVYCFSINPDVVNPVIVYDFRDRKYHLLQCISLSMSEEPNDQAEEFSAHLLKIVNTLYSAGNAENLVEMLDKALQYGK